MALIRVAIALLGGTVGAVDKRSMSKAMMLPQYKEMGLNQPLKNRE